MDEFVEQLRDTLGEDQVIDAADIEARYLRDWSSAPARTPMALVQEGRARAVMAYIDAIDAGGHA